MLPDATITEIRKRVAAVEPRYRLSAAIGHVAGFGSRDYGPLIALFNGFRSHPEAAADDARFHAHEFPAGAARQAELVAVVLAVLDGVAHEGRPQVAAGQAYLAALREHLPPPGGREAAGAGRGDSAAGGPA